MDSINDKTSYFVTVYFWDENGQAVTPNSGTYRLDSDNGIEIIASTPFTPSTTNYTISIPYTSNYILDNSKTFEIRKLTVIWLYNGSTSQGTYEWQYIINNLKGVT